MAAHADILAGVLVKRSDEGFSKLALAIAKNIAAWPSHIPREPLLNLAELYTGEKLPQNVGFPAFSLRVLTEAGERKVDSSFGWKAGDCLMCLPLIASVFQPAVTAKQLNSRGIFKLSIPWGPTMTRPATKDEAAAFVREAFGL